MTVRMKPVPTDRVVETVAEPGHYVYGVDRYRAVVSRVAASRWIWRVWDVVGRDLGGRAGIADGVERTKDAAMGQALDILRREAGIEQVVMGGA